MNPNKVIIPKEIALILDELLREKAKKDLIEWVIRQPRYVTPRHATLQRWGAANFDLLVRALYNGYEYEKTPEDEIREMFQNHPSSSFRLGVKMTLMRLGKRIEGIN